MNPTKKDKIHFKEVFFNGNFFSFWFGQIVSQFGERLSQMALIGLIYQTGFVSTQEMSKLLFAMIAPVFVFSPIAGVYVDRWDRKKVLIITDIIRAILVLLLPLFITYIKITKTTQMYPVYFIVFLVFAATRFFIPAKSAIIPEIMNKEHLRMANSISSTTKMIATVLGVLLGGFIVSMFGAVVCFYIDSATFLASAISVMFIKRTHIKKYEKQIKETFSDKIKLMKQQIMEGFSEIKKNPHVYFVVKILSCLMAASGAIFVIFPVFINKQFHTQANGLGLLVSFLGAGLFVGAIILSKLLHNTTNKKIISGSIISIAILFIILANLHHIATACAVMFIIGIIGIPIIVCTETMIHEMVEHEKIGRVYSCMEIIIHAFFLVSMGITGLIGDIASPGFIFSVLGTIFCIIMLLFFAHEKKCS